MGNLSQSPSPSPPPDHIDSDPVLQQLERSLMEGAYSKVWAACSASTNLPSPEFAFFTKTLTGTVREEIATCHEKAYSTLALDQARVLLFFERKEELLNFSKAVRIAFLLVPSSLSEQE